MENKYLYSFLFKNGRQWDIRIIMNEEKQNEINDGIHESIADDVTGVLTLKDENDSLFLIRFEDVSLVQVEKVE